MKCPKCNEDKDISDFMGQPHCYKCSYKEKVERQAMIKTAKKCRICTTVLISSRWVYCGKECADKGFIEVRNNYWIKKVKTIG